ncbi:MAG TPA: hypothetical protein V6C58_24400, partial [Allocoleopsis sp.]
KNVNPVYTLDVAGTIGNSGSFRQYVLGGGLNAASPTYSFYGDSNNGWFSPGGDVQAWSTNGNERMRLDDVGALGLGTSSPNASALLDVSSTTKGVLLPRMSGAQAEAIATPADGLVVYINSGNGVTITSTGFWGRDAGAWVKLS